ncbi:MFS transporter [Comamonas piscis]|uniref:MFS transporter n=1 Tax=Comamonas piscis TaxID=1562974 RepID=A0A7G5EH95_9BURK|nr:MFS transporter [Comamonas piscis]QMV73370.1 MFS transporter [Comamonas piscis]WSO36174.1 MFS transporter [Comamonas piscis]
MSPSTSTHPQDPARNPWPAVMAAGLATFSVVTTEMLPVGLLTAIAPSLGISTGQAGLMLSLPALLAVVFAPLVVLMAGNMDRRRILAGLLALLVLANAASALAPSWGWMLAARVLLGLCIGGIWAVAGGLAARLVPAAAMGLATSIIFGGVAAASVLGVPMGALIGEGAGWRWAFGVMAVFSALVLGLHLWVMPTLPVRSAVGLRQFLTLRSNRALQAGLWLSLLLVAGHFMAFTFVRPLLLAVSGFDAQWIAALLLAYGLAGIAGNFIAGLAAARRTTLTVAAIALGLLLVPLLWLAFGGSPTGGFVLLLFWGLAYGGVSVALMTWMMKAAPQAMEIAAALYVGVFNTGIALGAWAGGQVVDGWGLQANLWLAAAWAAMALLLSLGLAVTRHHSGSAAKSASPDQIAP